MLENEKHSNGFKVILAHIQNISQVWAKHRFLVYSAPHVFIVSTLLIGIFQWLRAPKAKKIESRPKYILGLVGSLGAQTKTFDGGEGICLLNYK